MPRLSIHWFFPFAALVAANAFADPALRRYELPNRDTLELTLPEGWSDRIEQPDGDGPPTIEITVTAGGTAQVFVTPKWSEPTDNDVREAPILRDAVRELAERIQPEAVESYIEVRPLEGADGTGYYFSATERAPKADGFKFMSQGAFPVGGLTLWFVVLTNDGEDTVAVQTLAMLQEAVHRRTGLDQL
jgi:hypothetical protein